ncbi:MAG: hypothetical protein KAS26_06035, partial [Sulfurimonas sp.]|nr:hypothetical protein [Sulfurimonas sp.]
YIILLLLVTTLFSDSYGNHGDHHISKELSHLNLSKAQNSKIKKILKNFRFDLKEYRDLREEIELEREKIFIEKIFDVNKLEKLNRKLDTKSYEIENRLLEGIHSILSKKQRREFVEYFDDWEVE